ncbi:MAG: M14 family zinc carboxypeptidase [Candidatus Aminicenantes bacterium]|nr:M14 family zinc carboxypeptidase [Candidatus Aminicenantes bacterium]
MEKAKLKLPEFYLKNKRVLASYRLLNCFIVAISFLSCLFCLFSYSYPPSKIKSLAITTSSSLDCQSNLPNDDNLKIGSAPSSFQLVASQEKKKERYLIRVRGKRENLQTLTSRPLDFATSAFKDHLDIIVTEDELTELLASGFQITIIQRETEAAAQGFDPLYHTYEETIACLNQAEITYPHLAKLFVIGQSTRFGFPIYALKISDNVGQEEDEPTILIDGLHHAREPLGNEICLAFIEYLLNNYGRSPRVINWVDDYEIWVIPILNPEGYKYIVDNNLSSPWWRKNLRDNNHNGRIDPDYDGVDLNRNYDYNWIYGGSTNPADWTYRGPSAFSEKETQAKRDLALRQKFVVSVTYHSYGEEVMYCWSWPNSGARAPDHDLIYEIASEMAKRIKNEAGTGTYSLARLSGANQSPIWMYGALGTLEFLIETGTSFIPPGYKIKPIIEANLEGLFYLLDRLKESGIRGKILDLITRQPLEAEISVLEIDNFQYIQPRTNDPLTGSFIRLLRPGKYTLLVGAANYLPKFISLTIGQEMTNQEILLRPESYNLKKTERLRKNSNLP